MDHLNSLIALFNSLDPAWYMPGVIFVAGYIQHKINQIKDFGEHKKSINVALSFGVAFLIGGLFGLFKVPEAAGYVSTAQTWLATTFVVGSPSYALGQAFFYGVFNRLKKDNPELAVAAGTIGKSPVRKSFDL